MSTGEEAKEGNNRLHNLIRRYRRKASRKELKYRHEHCHRRLRERYGINREFEEFKSDYRQLREKLSNGHGTLIGKEGDDEKRKIKYRGERVIVRFDPNRELILTFPPNHANPTGPDNPTFGEMADLDFDDQAA